MPTDDLIQKQLMAVIDKRTTNVCLHAHGQVQPADQPFDTLLGPQMRPPFHVHCRTIVMPYLPGFEKKARGEAQAELQRHKRSERLPPKSSDNVPTPQVVDHGERVYVRGSTDIDDMLNDPYFAEMRAASDPSVAQQARWGADGDELHRTMLSRQGYDGLPQVVTKADLDEAVDGGAIRMYRGVVAREFDPSVTAGYVDDFKNGTYFVGGGMAGPGSYVSPNFDLARSYATQYGQVMEMALRADARIATRTDLRAIDEARQAATDDAKSAAFKAQDEAAYRQLDLEKKIEDVILNDYADTAVAAGYDAILLGTEAGNEIYLILNRTALMVVG